MGFRDFHVFLGPVANSRLLFRAKGFRDFARHTKDERAGRHDHPLGDERLRANDRVSPDHRSVEDGGPHADEAFVFNRAGMNHSRVPDGDELPEPDRIIVSQMNDRAVLHVRGFADLDEIDVAAQDAAGPNAGPRSNPDVANRGRAGRDVSRWVHSRILGQKGGKLLVEIHALIMASSRLGGAGND